MKIGLIASPEKRKAWELKNLPDSTVSWSQDTKEHQHFDVWIDLDFDEHIERLIEYSSNTHTVFMLGCVFNTLEAAFLQISGYQNQSSTYTIPKEWKGIGINQLPTFLERQTLEFTNPFNLEISLLEPIFFKLGYPQWEQVNSRVGMVTPRVVCMIINEAYYTVQERTALPDDIDQAMKLGTNYPKGPFEWCKEIGINNVYKLLDAMYLDTREERYKICSLLKQDWLNSQLD